MGEVFGYGLRVRSLGRLVLEVCVFFGFRSEVLVHGGRHEGV